MEKEVLPDFQRLLDQYKGDIRFATLINKFPISEDEILYEIKTDKGLYYIFETDYISGFDHVSSLFKKFVGDVEFVEAQAPLLTFKDYPQINFFLKYTIPIDFDNFKQYLGYRAGSQPYFFNFLAKKIWTDATVKKPSTGIIASVHTNDVKEEFSNMRLDPVTTLTEENVKKLLIRFKACYWMLADEVTNEKRGIWQRVKKAVKVLVGPRSPAGSQFGHGELSVLRDVLENLGQQRVLHEMERETHQTLTHLKHGHA